MSPTRQRVTDQSSEVVDGEAAHDRGSVGFDGFDAEREAPRDVTGGETFGHQAEHVDLAGRQPAQRSPHRLRGGNRGAEPRQVLLEEVVVHAGLERIDGRLARRACW